MHNLIFDPIAHARPIVTLSEGFTLIAGNTGDHLDSTGQMTVDAVKNLDDLLEYLDRIEETCQVFDLEGAEWNGPKNGEGSLRFYASWEPNADDPSHFGLQTIYAEPPAGRARDERGNVIYLFELANSLVQVDRISLQAAKELVAAYSPRALERFRVFETSVVNEEGVRWVE